MDEIELQLIEESDRGGKRPIIYLLVLLAVLIALGAAAYKFLILDGRSADEVRAEHFFDAIKDAEAVGIQYELGTFIVNLTDKGADRYLKVTVVLDLQDKAVQEEVAQRLPKIKDAVRTLLFTKNSDEMKRAEGIEVLKEDVIKRINAILPIGGVKNVYFPDFVIQTA